MNTFKEDKVIAYTLLRLSMGINIFLHGAVRIPKLPEFEGWMQGLYSDSILPSIFVKFFGYGIPVLEVLIGVFILLGLFTQKAYLAGASLILVLIMGSCLIEKWDWAGIQMIYALFYFCLISFTKLNKISLDEWRQSQS